MRTGIVVGLIGFLGASLTVAEAQARTVRSAVPVLTVVPGRHPAPRFHRPWAAPIDVPLDPLGVVAFRTPFTAIPTPDGPALVRIPHYQGPDGTYDDLGDLTRSINGVPCGQECTARALARWGYTPD
jgi:hypothetical protein